MGTEINNDVRVASGLIASNLTDYMTYAPPVVSAVELSVTSLGLIPSVAYTGRGVLAPNGKIYYFAANVGYGCMVITPETEEIYCIDTRPFRTLSSAVCPNSGLIYCVDYDGVSVATLDPETDVFTTGVISQGGVGATYGLVPHPNKKMYAIPRTVGNAIGVIDTSNNTWSTITTGVTGAYGGGVLAPNGKIYCPPYTDTIKTVGIIDPDAGTMDNTTITGILGWVGGNYGYYNGALAPNGKIYFPPRGADRVLVVDTSNNAVSYITGLSTADTKWGNATLAPDGKIYCPPIKRTSVLIIDPETDTAEDTTITGLSGSSWKYFSSTLAPNGKIYTGCYNGHTQRLVITPGPAKLPIEPLLSPYVNCK